MALLKAQKSHVALVVKFWNFAYIKYNWYTISSPSFVFHRSVLMFLWIFKNSATSRSVGWPFALVYRVMIVFVDTYSYYSDFLIMHNGKNVSQFHYMKKKVNNRFFLMLRNGFYQESSTSLCQLCDFWIVEMVCVTQAPACVLMLPINDFSL